MVLDMARPKYKNSTIWLGMRGRDAVRKSTLKGKEKMPRTRVSYSDKAGKNGPMKLRSDFRAPVSMKNSLHHKSGEPVEERLHPNQQRRWHSYSSAS